MSEEESRNHVLAITLTELAFLITFILLFASAWTMRDSANTIEDEKDKTKEAHSLTASLKGENDRLAAEIEKLQEEVRGFEKIVKRSMEGLSGDFKHLVLRNAARAVALEDEIEHLESQLVEADNSVLEKDRELSRARQVLDDISQNPDGLKNQVVPPQLEMENSVPPLS